MKKKNKVFIIILISSVLPLVGHSSWLLVANKEVEYTYTKLNHPVVAVAYIKYSASNKQYTTTIERALELAAEDPAANTIYVIPGTNPTITRNTEIAEGDVLILPFDGETTGENFDNKIANGIADLNSGSVNNNRKNSVKLNDGITLTVKGKLIIGGQAGMGGTGHIGFTSKSYTEIVMGENSTINNNGLIDNYGYIKEYSKNNNSRINISPVGKISMPIVFYDYRGGTFSNEATSARHYVFPFTIFDMPSIQSAMTFTSGAILEGKVVVPKIGFIPASRKFANIVGGGSSVDSLFKIVSGSMTFKYTPNRDYNYLNNYTTNDADRATATENLLNITYVEIMGEVKFASLKIDVGVSINSALFFLPLSYKFQIKVKENSIINVENKMKFYKGALIEIEPGATANLNNETIFYQNYFDKTTTGGTKYPSYFNDSKHTARLINNGTLNINAAFAGKVHTSIPGAIINIGDGFDLEIVSREMITVAGTSDYSYTDVTGYAVGDISSDFEENVILSQISKTPEAAQYLSKGLWWLGTPGLVTPTVESIGEPVVVIPEEGGTCIDFDTVVTMGDGSTKLAGLLRAGDMIKVFNHETGALDVAPVIFNDDIDKEAQEYTVIYLKFSNGKQIKIVDEHAFFDRNTMKYEYIDKFNYANFIGHAFAVVSGDRVDEATLINAFIKTETIRICSPVSYYHLNLITEGFLSMPGGISGLFNIFDYGQNLQYDETRKNNDIEQFGLFTYDDFKEMVPLEFFEAFPTPYLKVSIGKGLLTMEQIGNLIERYLPVATEQQDE